jgi:NADPH:quinone reductase-like Zn-dependent oxidoreductase
MLIVRCFNFKAHEVRRDHEGSAGRIRSYGADQIIDYTATTLLQAVAGQRFDVVLNLVRTDAQETAALADLAADGGVLVSTTTPGPTDPGRGVRTVRVFVRSDADQLAGLVARVDAGDLKIDVAERRPWPACPPSTTRPPPDG